VAVEGLDVAEMDRRVAAPVQRFDHALDALRGDFAARRAAHARHAERDERLVLDARSGARVELRGVAGRARLDRDERDEDDRRPPEEVPHVADRAHPGIDGIAELDGLLHRVPQRLSREVRIAYGICQIRTNM
jgi:hypothetical protein